MAEGIEGGLDLVLIAGLLVCIGCLYSAKYLASALRSIFGFSVAGIRPLGWVADALAGLIESGADAGIKASERALAHLLSSVADMLELWLGMTALLGLAVKAALVYLWKTAIPAFVHDVARPIAAKVASVATDVAHLHTTVANNVLHAEAYARARAAEAVATAEHYAVEQARGAYHDATVYANEAVAKLRAAEDAAIATATSIAHAAEHAAAVAEQAAVTEATSIAHRELVAGEAAIGAALEGVKGIAVRTEDELRQLYGDLGLSGAAALIGSIPALALLVHTIATETGLDRAECRAKVKGVCGTDPGQWAGLLEGLLLVSGVISLREVVDVCRPLVKPAAEFIRQAA